MSKVRINDLARELEVKSRAILDVLETVGVTEKKTHSSSLEEDEAERVRAYLQRGRAGAAGARADSAPKPKIDLSKVSKPGDVLKAILQKKEQEAAARARPSSAKPAAAPPPRAEAAPSAAPPAASEPPKPA
ncbi:MAG: translation initiation factor IF-2 N-terminal domain-containing protein, partial [Acidobacteriaceae bacterium]